MQGECLISFISYFIMSCHVIWYRVVPGRVVSCYVVLCYVLFCYVMLRYDLLSHVISRHVLSYHIVSYHDIWIILMWYISHDDVIKWKHFPRYWPFVRGIHRYPVNSPHKGQWRGALMLSLICTWINSWVNTAEAGNLRRHLIWLIKTSV